MKSILQAALIASAAALLSACATGDGMSRAEPQTSYRQAHDQLVNNDEYMALVEQVALRRGVQVHWVNQPTRRIHREERVSAIR
jgi:outer membrane biogenesis lipoprotein LolB